MWNEASEHVLSTGFNNPDLKLVGWGEDWQREMGRRSGRISGEQFRTNISLLAVSSILYYMDLFSIHPVLFLFFILFNFLDFSYFAVCVCVR